LQFGNTGIRHLRALQEIPEHANGLEG